MNFILSCISIQTNVGNILFIYILRIHAFAFIISCYKLLLFLQLTMNIIERQKIVKMSQQNCQ